MSHNLLLSNKFKKIGWIILVPSFVLGIFVIADNFSPNWLLMKIPSFFPGAATNKALNTINMTNTLVGSLFIIGAVFVGFSKEKYEDEFISKLRSSSLLWAVFVNYSLLLVAFILIYNEAFLNIMLYNMFTVLLIFIIRFNYLLFKNSQRLPDEK